MAWWLWVLAAFALLVVELVTPGGFFALFFGVGALAVAAVAALGASPVIQWLVFPVVSLVLMLVLRARVQDLVRGQERGAVDSLVGEEVVLLEDLPANGVARAELRGSPWSARAASGIPLRAGQRCTVERIDGLVIYVRAA